MKECVGLTQNVTEMDGCLRSSLALPGGPLVPSSYMGNLIFFIFVTALESIEFWSTV